MAHIPQRRFGQNFLTDANIAKKIVRTASIHPHETVIEIGPGRGALTGLLVQQAKAVVAIELDKDLIQPLRAQFSSKSTVHIVQGDALRRYHEVVREIGDAPYVVVANIPYNITSALVRTILQTTPPVRRAVLMVQKEVAQRMTARAGAMSLLSLSVQLYADVKKCFDVAPSAFRPPPTVQSSVVLLTPHTPVPGAADPESILRYASGAFAKKRKLLVSNLAETTALPKEKIRDFLIQCGIRPDARSQDLSVSQWRALAAKLL